MPSDLPKICEERSRLLREYSDAASAYASSVRQMADFVMAGDEVKANELRRAGRTEWDAVEKSRIALYRHEADHACDRGAGVSSLCGQ
jgi:hypothetical protein